MLAALIAGRQDPAALAELAKGRMRSKVPIVTKALTGHFTAHHAFMAQLFLDRIDAHTANINTLSTRIKTLMDSFLPARELLESQSRGSANGSLRCSSPRPAPT